MSAGVDLGRELREVPEPRGDPVGVAAAGRLGTRDVDIGLGRVDGLGAVRAGGEQLELDRPDPAADVEQRRARDTFGDDRVDQGARRAVGPVLQVALEVVLGGLRGERVRATAAARLVVGHGCKYAEGARWRGTRRQTTSPSSDASVGSSPAFAATRPDAACSAPMCAVIDVTPAP